MLRCVIYNLRFLLRCFNYLVCSFLCTFSGSLFVATYVFLSLSKCVLYLDRISTSAIILLVLFTMIKLYLGIWGLQRCVICGLRYSPSKKRFILVKLVIQENSCPFRKWSSFSMVHIPMDDPPAYLMCL